MDYNSINGLGTALGIAITALYALTFCALMLWGGVSIDIEQTPQGMVVDFGTITESGSGEEDTALADGYSLPEPTATPQGEIQQTQQVEESPAVEQANIATDTSSTHEEQKDVEENPPVEEPKPREVNQRALFPGNTPSSKATSEGTTDLAEGNQGYIGGTQSDNHEGSGGEGGFEPDWNLEGRRPRSAFPKPHYVDSNSGVVVVEIWVNGSGNVVGASYQPIGSTVSAKSPLVEEALRAARGAKFNESEQDVQVGTITYKFTLTH